MPSTLSCPICEGIRYSEKKISAFGRSLMICESCMTGFFVCDLTELELKHHYEREYPQYLKEQLTEFDNGLHDVSAERSKQLYRLATKEDLNLIVDFGSGFPLTLAAISRYSEIQIEELVIIEPNLEARQWGEKRGLVCFSDFDAFVSLHSYKKTERRYLFHMNHVLEHLINPFDFLWKLENFLPKGSFIVGAVPNFHSTIALTSGENWEWLSYPEHLTYFNGYSLFYLLHRAGFKEIQISTNDEEIKLSRFLERIHLSTEEYLQQSSKLLIGNELRFQACK